MIPTVYKSKLSRLMSYPIKAITLSEALRDVPQIEDLSVRFYDSCQDPNKLENPCRILCISYSARRYDATLKSTAGGKYGSHWNLSVEPVPRVYVGQARTMMREKGFHKVRQWFHHHKDVNGKQGYCWIKVLYDYEADQLSYKEEDALIN